MRVTFPVSSQKEADAIYTKSFANVGLALLGALGVNQQPAADVTTATFTVPNDPSLFFFLNSGSAQTVTIPSGLTKYKPGQIINIIQKGAGAVTVAQGSGATINNQPGVTTRVSKGRYSLIQLVNMGVDTWILTAGGVN